MNNKEYLIGDEINNNEELIKLLQENKDLPIVFGIQNSEVDYDYGSTVCENYYAYVGTAWFDNDVTYFEREDIEDNYRSRLCNAETEDMTDDEYYKYVSEYVEKHVKHYKAIIISCYN